MASYFLYPKIIDFKLYFMLSDVATLHTLKDIEGKPGHVVKMYEAAQEWFSPTVIDHISLISLIDQ